DEIAPGGAKKRPKPGESAVGSGVATLAEPRGRVAAPIMVEARDPSATAFGAMALGGSLVLIVGGFVLTAAIMNTRPALVEWLMKITSQDKLLLAVFGGGFGLAALFGVLGLLIGKSSRA